MSGRDSRAVAELLQFLRPAFPSCSEPSRAYDHIGALLADLCLQAGVNYDYIVRPRVEYILERFPSSACVEGLRGALASVDIGEFLRWKGQTKIRLFGAVLEALEYRYIQDVGDLSSWTCTTEARETLLRIHGFGRKTFDYLRLLCGFESIPMDRHLLRFLDLAGVDSRLFDYDAAQELLLTACRQVGLEPYKAERGLWVLMRSCT